MACWAAAGPLRRSLCGLSRHLEMPGRAGTPRQGQGRGTHVPSLPACHILAMTLFQVVDCWTSCCLLTGGKDGEKALGGFHESTDSTAGTQGPTSSHHHRTGLGFDIGILGRHKHWVHEWIYEGTSVCFYQSLTGALARRVAVPWPRAGPASRPSMEPAWEPHARSGQLRRGSELPPSRHRP